MKITLVGPGIMPIPPTGWGAVEILIWEQKLALEKLGHEVYLINTPNPVDILQQINKFRPDFVYVQYDDFIELIPYIQYPCAITSHFGYLEQPNKWDYYGPRVAQKFNQIKPNTFCLSSGIKNIYKTLMNFPEEKLHVTPNGVNCKAFKVSDNPIHFDKSIYLAKIDYRKRQHMFQSIKSLWYAGNIADHRFNSSKNYLGEWDKLTLHENLTHYGNLVLLSDGEAHPLVCMEALASGLGVVVTEWGKANLDESKDFITIIPENKVTDIDYIEEKIIENRNYSISNRQKIIDYSKEFDWIKVIEKYYLPSIKKIIDS